MNRLNSDEVDIDEIADTNANGLDAIPKYGTNRIAIDPRKVFGLEMSNGLCVKRSSSARARLDNLLVEGNFLLDG